MTRYLLAGLVVVLSVESRALAQGVTPDPVLIERGRQLFTDETFNGNGRTCATCHPATNNFTIDPPFIATLPPTDPLFVHEFNPDLSTLESATMLRKNALILENQDGFDRPGNMRAVPHVLGMRTSITPDADGDGDQTFPDGTTPVNAVGWSADGGIRDGSLQGIIAGAVAQHFPRSMARVEGQDFRFPTQAELDAMEQFILSLGRQDDIVLANLSFHDPAAQRGSQLFQGNGANRACTDCHANAGANVIDGREAFNDNFDIGTRNVLALQSSPDGGFGQDDQGLGGFGNGTFNVPPLIEAADTAPFFHNNAATTLESAITFYTTQTFAASPTGNAFGGPFDFDDQDISDVASFLRALNALDNVANAQSVAGNAIRQKDPVSLLNAQRAASQIDDAIEVLQTSNLAPEAVQQLFQARDAMAAAVTTTNRGQRNRFLAQARTALNPVRSLIVEDQRAIAGN